MSSAHVRHHREASVDSLSTYLEEIRAYPLLTRDQEVALAKRIRAGDKTALDRLVCSNLRFVVSVAKKYQGQGLPLADLVNEGNLGLLRAAEKFDESKGVKFISYAVWWIRQAIVQTLAEQGNTVRVPVNRAGVMYRVERRANLLRQELGREPTREELTTGLEGKDAQAAKLMPMSRAYVSLDAALGEDEDVTLLDYLADEAGVAPDQDATEGDLVESVEAAMHHLRGREERVLRLYFGLDGEEPMTLEGIGELLGVTRERVRQLKQRALSRLKKSSSGSALASLYGH